MTLLDLQKKSVHVDSKQALVSSFSIGCSLGQLRKPTYCIDKYFVNTVCLRRGQCYFKIS